MTDLIIMSVHAGGYEGSAVVGGYDADVVLSATQQFEPDDQGCKTTAGVTWSGTAIILDLRASSDLLELTGSVKVTIGERTSRARIVDANPGSRSLQLHGASNPPFDIDPVT